MMDWNEPVPSEPDEVHVFLGRLDRSLDLYDVPYIDDNQIIASSAGGDPARIFIRRRIQAAVRWLIAQLTGCDNDEVQLCFDSYGRPVLADGTFYLGVSRDADDLLVAIARARVAASMHWVPPAYDDAALSLLTPLERRLVARVTPEARAHVITRLWTRKDAALRLCRRRLLGAGQVEVLVEGGSGTVLVPGSSGQGHATVVVTDLPVIDNAVAAVATWHRPRVTRLWSVSYGSAIACQPSAVDGPTEPLSMNSLSSRQISSAGL